MGEFKKGDFVRRTSGSSLHTSSGHHEAGFVGQVSDVKFRGGTNDIIFTNGHEGIAQNYEPWQPRVGERVRYSGKSKCYSEKELVGLEGVVTETGDRQAVVKWDKAIVDGIRTGGAKYIENIEPILGANTTPEQPTTLKIEAGKFYKTRDGRKVGPMRDTGGTADHWTTPKTEIGLPHWQDNGSHWSGRTNPTDLIAEWIDEPVDKASNDNRADAGGGFKAGDKIRLVRNPAGRCKIGDEFVAVARGSNGGYASSVHYTDGDGSMTWRPGSYFELVTPPTTTVIVALIENGLPKPSSTPHVHTSTGAAEKEAKRLAAKYKGQQFGVFTLTTTHEQAAPVYDHKWQNLAALGLKIDAIKELRAVAGLTLKGAKDAVEAWVDYRHAA